LPEACFKIGLTEYISGSHKVIWWNSSILIVSLFDQVLLLETKMHFDCQQKWVNMSLWWVIFVSSHPSQNLCHQKKKSGKHMFCSCSSKQSQLMILTFWGPQCSNAWRSSFGTWSNKECPLFFTRTRNIYPHKRMQTPPTQPLVTTKTNRRCQTHLNCHCCVHSYYSDTHTISKTYLSMNY
jgi:hypothetical protein